MTVTYVTESIAVRDLMANPQMTNNVRSPSTKLSINVKREHQPSDR